MPNLLDVSLESVIQWIVNTPVWQWGAEQLATNKTLDYTLKAMVALLAIFIIFKIVKKMKRGKKKNKPAGSKKQAKAPARKLSPAQEAAEQRRRDNENQKLEK